MRLLTAFQNARLENRRKIEAAAKLAKQEEARLSRERVMRERNSSNTMATGKGRSDSCEVAAVKTPKFVLKVGKGATFLACKSPSGMHLQAATGWESWTTYRRHFAMELHSRLRHRIKTRSEWHVRPLPPRTQRRAQRQSHLRVRCLHWRSMWPPPPRRRIALSALAYVLLHVIS
jgi:hypothetical protein